MHQLLLLCLCDVILEEAEEELALVGSPSGGCFAAEVGHDLEEKKEKRENREGSEQPRGGSKKEEPERDGHRVRSRNKEKEARETESLCLCERG